MSDLCWTPHVAQQEDVGSGIFTIGLSLIITDASGNIRSALHSPQSDKPLVDKLPHLIILKSTTESINQGISANYERSTFNVAMA
jgi:hypothetical protein